MTAISDADASNPSADNVTLKTPFPFWLGVITVTAASVLADDGSALSGAFILTPSVPVYLAGWGVLEGSATLTVTAGTGTPVVIPTTDTAGTAFTYTIAQRLVTPDDLSLSPVTGVAVPHTLGLTVDISALL